METGSSEYLLRVRKASTLEDARRCLRVRKDARNYKTITHFNSFNDEITLDVLRKLLLQQPNLQLQGWLLMIELFTREVVCEGERSSFSRVVGFIVAEYQQPGFSFIDSICICHELTQDIQMQAYQKLLSALLAEFDQAGIPLHWLSARRHILPVQSEGNSSCLLASDDLILQAKSQRKQLLDDSILQRNQQPLLDESWLNFLLSFEYSQKGVCEIFVLPFDISTLASPKSPTSQRMVLHSAPREGSVYPRGITVRSANCEDDLRKCLPIIRECPELEHFIDQSDEQVMSYLRPFLNEAFLLVQIDPSECFTPPAPYCTTLGFVFGTFDRANYCYVDSFAVSGASRGLGVGRILMDELKKRCLSQNKSGIWLAATKYTEDGSLNKRTLRFYTRYGFISCGDIEICVRETVYM